MCRQDRLLIYATRAAVSNAHCGQPGYNHAKQNNKTRRTQIQKTKKLQNFITTFPVLHYHYSIFKLFPLHLHSLLPLVVRLGSALAHTTNMTGTNRQRNKKLKKIDLKKSYNTVYNKSLHSASNSLLKEDTAGCITFRLFIYY